MVLRRLINWLLLIADEWYLSETETLVQIAGMLSARRRQQTTVMEHTDETVDHVRKVWRSLMQSRAWSGPDWESLWNDIDRQYTSNAKYLTEVTDMITTFIPRKSAEALTKIMTTNPTITRRQRDELVSMYREYNLLCCFDDETLVPMVNSSVVATGREGCKTRFKCAAMQILPMTFTSEQISEIEDQLIATRTHLAQGNILRGMMEGSGVPVLNDSTLRTSTAETSRLTEGMLDDPLGRPVSTKPEHEKPDKTYRLEKNSLRTKSSIEPYPSTSFSSIWKSA